VVLSMDEVTLVATVSCKLDESWRHGPSRFDATPFGGKPGVDSTESAEEIDQPQKSQTFLHCRFG